MTTTTNMKKINNLIKTNDGLFEVVTEDDVLILDEDTILKFRLFKGNFIDDDSINEIIYNDSIIKLSKKMLEYRTKYSKSINEIKRHFLTKNINQNIIDDSIEILINKKLINDFNLASSIASSLARNSNGPLMIKEKLKQRLFTSDEISYAINNISTEDIYYGKEKLLNKLNKKYLNEDEKIRKYKIIKQLYAHGYKMDE